MSKSVRHELNRACAKLKPVGDVAPFSFQFQFQRPFTLLVPTNQKRDPCPVSRPVPPDSGGGSVTCGRGDGVEDAEDRTDALVGFC